MFPQITTADCICVRKYLATILASVSELVNCPVERNAFSRKFAYLLVLFYLIPAAAAYSHLVPRCPGDPRNFILNLLRGQGNTTKGRKQKINRIKSFLSPLRKLRNNEKLFKRLIKLVLSHS